jgi:hypothetical protein
MPDQQQSDCVTNAQSGSVKLPPVVSARRVGERCFDMQRTAVYSTLANGTFPVAAIRAGGRWVVPTAALRRVLELSAEELVDVLGLDPVADLETVHVS